MILKVRELEQGRNDCSFDVPEAEFSEFLNQVDDLYGTDGGGLEAGLTIDRYEENLLVRGNVFAPYRFKCARCLAERSEEFDHQVYWTMLPQRALNVERLSEEEEIELGEDDLDVSFYEGEEVNLKTLVREIVLLELESAPTCKGGCEENEVLSRIISEEEADNQLDPRWEKLKELKKSLKSGSSDSTE